MNNSSKRRKQRMTALMLAATLLLGGCNKSKNDRFELTENNDNQLVAMDDSYIDNDFIDKYYLLEVYNKVTGENELYIVRFDGKSVGFMGNYTEVFTNLEISVGYMGSTFDCVKITALSGHLVSFGLAQARYSYDDMRNIYEVIKENYVFENDESLRRILTNNRI